MDPELNKLFTKLEAIEQMYIDDETKHKRSEIGRDWPLTPVHLKQAHGIINHIRKKKMTSQEIHDEIDEKYQRLRQLVGNTRKNVLTSMIPGMNPDISSEVIRHLHGKSKKTKKKKKKTKKKKKKTTTLTDETYLKLLKKKRTKKRMSKKDKRSLDKELNRKFCRCLRTVKYNKRIKKGSQYPICMSSIYKNRGFEVPSGIIKTCNK